MAGAGLVEQEDVFSKDGKIITFRRGHKLT